MTNSPDGKFLASAKIGAKGQIVIPKEVREMFNLQTGDSLIIMADINQGIALQPYSYVEQFWNAVQETKKGDNN